MAISKTATSLAGVSVVLAGGFLAIGRGFSNAPSSPALVTDLQQLFDTVFQAAPLVGVLLVGLLIFRASGGL